MTFEEAVTRAQEIREAVEDNRIWPHFVHELLEIVAVIEDELVEEYNR